MAIRRARRKWRRTIRISSRPITSSSTYWPNVVLTRYQIRTNFTTSCKCRSSWVTSRRRCARSTTFSRRWGKVPSVKYASAYTSRRKRYVLLNWSRSHNWPALKNWCFSPRSRVYVLWNIQTFCSYTSLLRTTSIFISLQSSVKVASYSTRSSAEVASRRETR